MAIRITSDAMTLEIRNRVEPLSAHDGIDSSLHGWRAVAWLVAVIAHFAMAFHL